jgi:hypothetical protein
MPLPVKNMDASTQAIGLFGAFLRFSEFNEMGKPLPETLRSLGSDYSIQDLKAMLCGSFF